MGHEKQLFIFDLDGTLADSRDDISASANDALGALGFAPVTREQVTRGIGRGTAQLFRDLLGAGTSDALIERLVARFRNVYARRLAERTRLYDGVPELLGALQPHLKVIVTNKSQAFADSLIERLGVGRQFKAIYGAEAFAERKPSPLPLLEACRAWRVNPRNAVVVGDTINDIRAGKAAGMTTVAVLYGYGSAADLRGAGADYEVATVRELIPLLSPGARA